jgi:hypothetical protein
LNKLPIKDKIKLVQNGPKMAHTLNALSPRNIDNGDSFNSRKKRIIPYTLLVLGITVAFTATILNLWDINLASAFGVHRPISMLEHAGGVKLTADELKEHTPLPTHDGSHRHWMGPIAGFVYTTNCITPGVLKVGYFQSSSSSPSATDFQNPFILVTTFDSEFRYEEASRPLVIDVEHHELNVLGNTIYYRHSSMNTFTYRQKHSGEVITVTYSSPQSVETMVRDSEKISPL